MTALIAAPTSVYKAAKILDGKIKGWYKRINISILAMGNPENCILGQLFNGNCYDQNIFDSTIEIKGWSMWVASALSNGFDYAFPQSERKNHKAWVRQIEKRLARNAKLVAQRAAAKTAKQLIKLEDVNPADNQQVFDYVVQQLRLQGVKATSSDDNINSCAAGKCKYRGPDNTKCAAGQLIPNSDYNPSFEGYSVIPSNVNSSSPDALVSVYFGKRNFDLKFVKRLQTIHDTIPVGGWESEWQDLASDFKLVYSSPVVK